MYFILFIFCYNYINVGDKMFNSQLETFVVIADEGSFSKAAEKLFISTTAVIKQINTLEEDIDIKLFNRSFKGVSLTEAGKSFL